MLEQVSLAPDYLLHPVQEKWVLENVPTHVYVEMRLFPSPFPHLEQRQKVALPGQVILFLVFIHIPAIPDHSPH